MEKQQPNSHLGAPEHLLLPPDELRWEIAQPSLEMRGVDGGYVFNLIHEIQELRNKTVETDLKNTIRR